MDTSTSALPQAVQEGLAKWKSGTIQTLGPLITTPAFNALAECLAGLDHVVAASLAKPTEPPQQS